MKAVPLPPERNGVRPSAELAGDLKVLRPGPRAKEDAGSKDGEVRGGSPSSPTLQGEPVARVEEDRRRDPREGEKGGPDVTASTSGAPL